MSVSTRTVALLSMLAAAGALFVAFASETWGGMVPCALCLLERLPYWIAIVLGALGFLTPPRVARALIALLMIVVLADAAMAFVHVGVEAAWWPSPLPECAAPRITGGSIAERLASMPARPAKPCDAPTYLIPGIPLSMAAMNLIFALVFAATVGICLGRRARPHER